MTTPWNIMDQLQNWASMLQDHIDKLPLSSEQMMEYQKKSLYRCVEHIHREVQIYVLSFQVADLHRAWGRDRVRSWLQPHQEDESDRP